MYKHRKPVFQPVDPHNHPDYEIKDTRVSDYLRRYGTGHLDDLPQTSAPEISDDRTVDEMLDSDFEPSMSTETVDILMEIEKNKDRFEKAAAELELTKKQRQQYDDAIKVLNDSNAPNDRQREAYSILMELMEKGKVTRVRG